MHSSLKQDHVLKGLPALGSPGLVGLEGGHERRHEASQELRKLCRDIVRGIIFHGACESQRAASVSALEATLQRSRARLGGTALSCQLNAHVQRMSCTGRHTERVGAWCHVSVGAVSYPEPSVLRAG